MSSGSIKLFARLAWAFLAYMVLLTTAQAGPFQFNFDPHSNGTQLTGGANVTGGLINGNDGTRFYQDTIEVGSTTYIHVVVGDPALGFVQESYTASTVLDFRADPWRATVTGRPYSNHSGGNERLIIGNFSTNEDDIGRGAARRFGNAGRPLGGNFPVEQRYRISGVGTMDPSRVVLRLQVSDGDMAQEVFKPFLDRKPKISQSVSDETLSSQFVADMRGLTYSDMNRAAPLINKMSINDPAMPAQGAGASFDMSMSNRSYVTAGRYIFSRVGRFDSVTHPGTGEVTNLTKYGWQNCCGWDVTDSVFNPGVYTYSDDGFDPVLFNWKRYFDPAQN